MKFMALLYLVKGDWTQPRVLFEFLYILFVFLTIYGSHISIKLGYPGFYNMLK